jgi:VCBS repeat-containing protein
VEKNQSLTIDAAGVLANDGDDDGDRITAVLVDGPSHGTLVLNEEGSFVYTPEIGFIGVDVFTYRAQDTEGSLSNIVAVRITVTGSNDTASVSLIADPWDASKVALRIIGTDENDQIQIVEQGNTGTFKVTVNNVFFGQYAGATRILAYGLGGNDRIQMSGGAGTTAIFLGGDGNDDLTGGSGATILLGGAGNDSLSGGKKGNILVGGDGKDRLTGGKEDDILIGDVIHDQLALTSLVSALDQWRRLDLTYVARVNLLGGPSGISGVAVTRDNESDMLIGSGGMEWFFVGTKDEITGSTRDQVVTIV